MNRRPRAHPRHSKGRISTASTNNATEWRQSTGRPGAYSAGDLRGGAEAHAPSLLSTPPSPPVARRRAARCRLCEGRWPRKARARRRWTAEAAAWIRHQRREPLDIMPDSGESDVALARDPLDRLRGRACSRAREVRHTPAKHVRTFVGSAPKYTREGPQRPRRCRLQRGAFVNRI